MKPYQNLTIERRDNNKGYSPENCYWGTSEEQQNNRRTNIRLTVHDETLTLAQWERKLELRKHSISHRLDAMRLMDARIRSTNPADTASKLKMIAALSDKTQSLIYDLAEAGKRKHGPAYPHRRTPRLPRAGATINAAE